MYYDGEDIKIAIINHMKSINLIDKRHCVSKIGIVLVVCRKLKIDESKEYLIKEAFDILVEEGKIRSRFNIYDENGKITGISASIGEEKFYLK